MRLRKLDAAVSQLDQAIRLFLEGDHLSSLTLAGAAEEILGRLSERAGLPVATEQVAAYHMDNTDPALSGKARKKVLFKVMNQARNEAKHANPEETHIAIEQDFPLQMIMRAMPMARRAAPQGDADGRVDSGPPGGHSMKMLVLEAFNVPPESIVTR